MSEPDTDRVRRIGLNEAVFREVNEQIERLEERFGGDRRTLDLICECGSAACAERIQLGRDEYERVRADPTYFAVVPGHEIDEVEKVVDRRDGYYVLSKREGTAERVARSTDTRDRG
jgi:hypothetical protein